MIRKIMIAGLFMVLGLSGLQAEIYMRQVSRTDGYYHHGQMEPALERVFEFWVAREKLAMKTPSRRVIIDHEKKQFTFINLEEKSYFTGSLPISLEAIFPESVVKRIKMYPTRGLVEPLKQAKSVAGIQCRGYKITSWIDYDGSKYNESHITNWMAESKVAGQKNLSSLLNEMRGLNNYTPEFRQALAAIPGVAFEVVSLRYREGSEIKNTTRIEKIEQRKAPNGIFQVPGDFKKKEKMTVQDVRGL